MRADLSGIFAPRLLGFDLGAQRLLWFAVLGYSADAQYCVEDEFGWRMIDDDEDEWSGADLADYFGIHAPSDFAVPIGSFCSMRRDVGQLPLWLRIT